MFACTCVWFACVCLCVSHTFSRLISALISLECTAVQCLRKCCDRVLARSSFIAIVGVNSKVISAHRFDFRGRNASKLIVHFDSRLEKEKSFANPRNFETAKP